MLYKGVFLFIVLFLSTSSASNYIVFQGNDYTKQASLEEYNDAESISVTSAVGRAWSSLEGASHQARDTLSPVVNPFSWFMQQMQRMEHDLAAVSGQLQPPATQELLRHVGCQRLRNGALRDYQVAMGDIISQEGVVEGASQRFGVNDVQEAINDVIDIMDSERAEVVNGRSKPSVQVVVGTVRSDGGVQTTRYTADDNGDMHVTTDTYTNNHGQQQLEEQQEEEEGDNLDEAASIADLMMDEVRSAYQRGQQAAAARAHALHAAFDTASINNADDDYVVVDIADVVGIAPFPQRASLAGREGPLGALAQLLDSLLLGGISAASTYNPLALEAAERAKVVAAVQEQMQREALLEALMASRSLPASSAGTAAAAAQGDEGEGSAYQQARAGAASVRGAATTTDTVMPFQAPFMDTPSTVMDTAEQSWSEMSWTLIDPRDGSINSGMVLLLLLVFGTALVAVGFVRSWVALRAAMNAGGEVLVPVLFEHEGRVTHGYVMLPRAMAGAALEEAEWGCSSKGCRGSPIKVGARAGHDSSFQEDMSVGEQKEEAQKVWGAKQVEQEQREEEEFQGVVIAAEHAERHP